MTQNDVMFLVMVVLSVFFLLSELKCLKECKLQLVHKHKTLYVY